MKLSLPRFDKAQILVVGDIMLDRYWHGETSRVSPEAPVPIVKVEQVEDRPGAAANVALNIAALGAGVSLVGPLGNDEAAGVIRGSMQAANVHVDLLQVEDRPTITKLRVISRHQQLIRMDFEEPFSDVDAAALAQKGEKLLSTVGALVLSDYAKGALSDPQPLIRAARAARVPVFVDPKGIDFTRYRGATLIKPNLHEFELIVGPCSNEQELVSKGQALISELEIEALLITRSENGMTLIQASGAELHFPAKAREVFDVTGAGDTVISVLAAARAAGEKLPEAVALANIAAGIVVAKLGTAAVSAPELRNAVSVDQGSERGVMTVDQLSSALANARLQGEKVVFTNGCFDIIHAGHVGYLEQARALGDRLIVAINSDDSVTRLKGTGRPINPVDRRMAVLAGLQSVDWVVSFSDDTPESLISQFQPDILVKGGDYDAKDVVGWELVASYGGEVKVLSFFDDCSTTAIVEKVLEKNLS